jgi:anti-sigma B factor antagonist
MDLGLEPAGDVMVVAIPGETLDAGNTQEFKTALGPVLDSHGKVVFDMSALGFVDSSGCGALLSCLRKVRANDGELKLCGVRRQIQDLFNVIRMDQIFEIFGSRQEAVSSFAA